LHVERDRQREETNVEYKLLQEEVEEARHQMEQALKAHEEL